MVVCNNAQLEWILNSQLSQKFNIFVKIDSGMGRLGFLEHESNEVINILENSPNVDKLTLMTHFSSADNIESSSTNAQIDKFNNIVDS